MSTDPCETTVNTDPLQQPMFTMTIARLPSTTYFIQKTNLPSMTGGVISQRTPVGSAMKLPGGSIDHGPLNIEFKLDSNFLAYWDVYRWMQECYGISDSKLKVVPQNMMSDMQLMILDNNRVPKFSFTYVSAWPIAIGEVQFDSTVKDVVPVAGFATFEYQYIKFKNVRDDSLTPVDLTSAGRGVSILGADGQLKKASDC